MSHFVVIVLGDNVEGQLAPYNENMEVEPYEDDCYCARHSQNKIVGTLLKEQGHDIDEYRARHRELEPKKRTTWAEFIKPLVEAREKLEAANPPKPESDCDECEGTGKCLITYNPKSRWDWYLVGGRWRGFLKAKPGVVYEVGDPGVFKNEAEHGHGDILRLKDIDFDAMDHAAEEHGEKTWERYQALLAEAGDNRELQEKAVTEVFGFFTEPPRNVEECAAMFEKPYITQAVVKDGEWYERGKMGWFGMSHENKPAAGWEAEWRKLVLESDPETLVTVIDCHI